MNVAFVTNKYSVYSAPILKALFEDPVGVNVIAILCNNPNASRRATVIDLVSLRIFKKLINVAVTNLEKIFFELGLLQKTQFRNVYDYCYSRRVNFYETKDINNFDSEKVIKSFAPDMIVLCSLSQRIKKNIIDIPKKICINIHPSLLPKHAGPRPGFWTLYAGDKFSGYSVHKVTSQVDRGDIIAQEKFSITGYHSEDALLKHIFEKASIEIPNILKIIEDYEPGKDPIRLNEESCYESFPTQRKLRFFKKKFHNNTTKKILFCLGHPSHFHLYKNIIHELKKNGCSVIIAISNKDILERLLDEYEFNYEVISEKKNDDNFFKKISKVLISTFYLYKVVIKNKPDLMIGCLTQMGIVGFVTGISAIFNAEDDINYTYLQSVITYPFMESVIAPTPINVSVFSYKKISYEGYQKLAYLHPRRFQPDKSRIKMNKGIFFIIRLANLRSYHDINNSGINDKVLDKVIDILTPRGQILITSERSIPERFERYRFRGDIKDMHHYLFFASLYIGDSQSMAVEAALLGVPGIRFNKFAGRISILNELENKYGLTFGITSSETDKLYRKIEEIVEMKDSRNIFQERREKMLNDKIDVTSFLVWFIKNYPESRTLVKNNPEFWERFK